MPLYEYRCNRCGRVTEAIETIRLRDLGRACTRPACKGFSERILSVPTMHVWDQSRPFPNLSREGDGSMTFRTKADYHGYLAAEGIRETKLHAKISKPHGNKVIARYGST